LEEWYKDKIMHISEFCVKRPVFSIVITLFIILIGVISGSKLPVQLMPLVERPSIEVKGEYVGASPAMVEMQVTKVLEGYLSTITGMEEMKSDSKADESEIVLKFSIGTKLEDAVNDVRDAVSKAMSEDLPDTMKMPTITKYNPDDSPIIQFALKSKGTDLLKVKDYAERYIKNKFEILDGVAKVEVYGGSKYAMNLILDPIKLAGHKVSVTEVREAVQKQNFESPAGRIIGKDREFAITVMANLKTPEEFDNIVVATRGDNIIRIKDIGKTELGEKEVREKSYFNGEEVIGLAIYKQSSANPVSISKKAYELFEKQKQDLPDNIEIVVSYDATDYIKDSIFHVYKTIAEAIIFVIFVIYLFLCSFKASLVPLLAIPVSLIGVLAFLNLMGFSINNLTLLAMVLAIGLVVDDAIVILENIYKKMEEGQ